MPIDEIDMKSHDIYKCYAAKRDRYGVSRCCAVKSGRSGREQVLCHDVGSLRWYESSLFEQGHPGESGPGDLGQQQAGAYVSFVQAIWTHGRVVNIFSDPVFYQPCVL